MATQYGKIDVTKIDEAKLFKGAKGTYLDIVLIETPNNEFGTHMIVQSATKEERAQGIKGAVLGNIKRMDSAPARTTEANDDPFA